jgi:hypothetical protein
VWVELITQEENRLKQTCYAYAKRTRRTNERSRFSNLPKVSGKTMCKRSIMEGRGNVRAILYMATLVAIRHNEKFKAYYAHLKSVVCFTLRHHWNSFARNEQMIFRAYA